MPYLALNHSTPIWLVEPLSMQASKHWHRLLVTRLIIIIIFFERFAQIGALFSQVNRTYNTNYVSNFLPPPGFELEPLGTVSRWLIHYATVPHSIFLLYFINTCKLALWRIIFTLFHYLRGKIDRLILICQQIYEFRLIHLQMNYHEFVSSMKLKSLPGFAYVCPNLIQ